MKEFLKVLSKRLYFLDGEEKSKVLEDYRKKIEEKYRETKDMSESIDSLGDIDSIVLDICKKYNLNTELCKRENKFDKNVKSVSKMIGNFIRDIMKIVRRTGLKMNLESFLEVSVKIIFLMVVFTLIKLPFMLLNSFSGDINNFLFYPYNNVFDVTTNSILSLCYYVVCIILTLKVFGNYEIKPKKIINEEKIESIDKEYNWLDLIIRLVVYLMILIPIGILIIFLLALAFTFIYLVVTGINLVGIPGILFGLSGLLICLFLIILDALKQRDRSYGFILWTSMLLFLIGCGITLINYTSFKHSANLDKSNIEMTTEEFKITLEEDVKDIYIINGEYEVLVDKELGDNELRVLVTYCDDYNDYTYEQKTDTNIKFLYIKGEPDKYIDYDKITNAIVSDLRKGYIFNYSDARKLNVKIYANEDTKKKIEG